MHKVLVTFLPKEKSGDVLYMDIHKNFLTPPKVGDFVTFGGSEVFRVVQVVHCLAQDETTFSVTLAHEDQLPNAALLRSSESRKGLTKLAERMIRAPKRMKHAAKRKKKRAG